MATSESVRTMARPAGRIASPRAARGAAYPAVVALKYGTMPALLILIWEIAPRLNLVSPVFFPPFSVVAHTAWSLLLSGVLPRHAMASVGRAGAGLMLATALAVPLGVGISASRLLSDMLSPVLEAFRNTSPLALLPAFTLVLGIGEVSKVTMVVYATFWPILLNTIAGVRGVDRVLVKAGRAMGLSRVQLVTRIVLPAAMPTIFTGIRLAMSAAFLVLIAAEMNGARAGLGFFVNSAQANFQIPEMYSGILALSAVGLFFNGALVLLGRRIGVLRKSVAP
ncbi:ABC transporter permease [Gluconacetobacter johannae]|nr:ABC transporter permease [Gluconacetobacter johannae]